MVMGGGWLRLLEVAAFGGSEMGSDGDLKGVLKGAMGRVSRA